MDKTEVNTNEVVANTENNQEIDYKALYEESKAEAEAKAEKVNELEGLIQKHKKKPKSEETKQDTNIDVESIVQKTIEKERFYAENPEMSEYKDAINEFISKGLSYSDAKVLVMRNDPTIQARKNTSNANFTDWMSWGGTKTYTQEQLANMPRDQKMSALREIAEWKATETL